jgi:Flp pilus assembly protein TadG
MMTSTQATQSSPGTTTHPPVRRSRRGRTERAQSLVEFALVLPVLLIMVFGIIDFGMGIRSYISLTNATREGARFAAVGNVAGAYPTDCDGATSTTVIGRVCVSIEGLDLTQVQVVSVSYPDGEAPGNSVIVAADYTYNYITPLGDFLDFFSGGSFPDSLALSTSTDMRLE